MKTADFDFALPEDRIARYPAKPRDSARLLVVGEGLEDRRVSDLPAILRPGDLMVFNDTKVIPAQLRGKRGEAGIDVTLLRPRCRRRKALAGLGPAGEEAPGRGYGSV